MAIKCFFIKPTGQVRISLRRYAPDSVCRIHSYHDAMKAIEERYDVAADGTIKILSDEFVKALNDKYGKDAYPVQCECGYIFSETDKYDLFREAEYFDDDKNLIVLRTAPVGAMWYADWYLQNNYRSPGPDGHCLIVKTPGGNWNIDSRASNCTLPDDNVHKCWVRHGEPPMITVDKNGHTCAAGAGSIQIGNYHGFLRNGELTP